LRSDDCFTDEGNGDANGTDEKRLLAADAIEEEDDEKEVEDGPNNVVDAGDEEIAVADYAEVFVENSRVVADNVDTMRILVHLNRQADKKRTRSSA
jgi:hypothetical protein